MCAELDPLFGNFSLRAGYKGLFLDKEASEYGVTFGAGIEKFLMNNIAIKINYAFRDIGVLGNVHSYTFGFLF